MNPLGTVYITDSNCWTNSCIFSNISFFYLCPGLQSSWLIWMFPDIPEVTGVQVLLMLLPLMVFICSGIYVLINPSE